MTKIAIPIKEDFGDKSVPSEHFGRSRWFYIVDGDQVQVISNNSDHFGGAGKPPETLIKLGINVLIATNMGRKAIDMFQQSDVAVFRTPIQTVGDILVEYKNGQLDELTEGCTHSKHD
jgi:predicted Fe-Mo cluster-binding NifX family protein